MPDLGMSGCSQIDAAQMAELRRAVQSSPKGRTRICMHDSHDEPVQQMLIAVCRDSYIRPHKQRRNGKSYILIEGSLNVAFFDDDGRLTRKLKMSRDGVAGPAMVRFQSDQWHTVAATSDVALYLEIAAGPYDARDTIYAPWAPAESDIGASAFLAQLTADEPSALEPRQLFLSVSNPRTGSSYLITSLNELPGIHADYEFKWKPRYALQPVHIDMAAENWTSRSALTQIGMGADIGGSKLVFDCVPFDRNAVADLRRRIDPDIPLIHLTRNYFDVILSLKAHGAFNLMNRPPTSGVDNSVIGKALSDFDRRQEFRQREAGRPVTLDRPALENALLCLVKNDLICLALCQQAKRSMRVDYAQLHDALPEITEFVGYEGDRQAIEAVRDNPITRKMTSLAPELIPDSEAFRSLCDFVYAKVIFVCEMNIPFDEIWNEDGSIDLPGVHSEAASLTPP